MKKQINKLIKEITPTNKERLNQLGNEITERKKEELIEEDIDRHIINPQIRARDKGECCFCGKDVFEVGQEVGGGNTIHHILPRRYGGKAEDKNLITICAICHARLEKYINVVERATMKNTLDFTIKKLKEIENGKDI